MHRSTTKAPLALRQPRLVPSGIGALGVAAGLVLAATPVPAAQLVVTDQLERAAFWAADTDGDGLLDEAELAADVVAAFALLDGDGDGVITPLELPPASATAFARIDIDGDQKIVLEEVRLHKLNDFARADRDLDRRVSMAELLLRSRWAQP